MFVFIPFTLYKASIKISDSHFTAPANTDVVQNYSADTKTLISLSDKSVLFFWQVSVSLQTNFNTFMHCGKMEISPEIPMIQHFYPEQNHLVDLW